jgi:hypothetical protein
MDGKSLPPQSYCRLYSMWHGMVLYVARRYADAVVALNRVFKPDLWS